MTRSPGSPPSASAVQTTVSARMAATAVFFSTILSATDALSACSVNAQGLNFGNYDPFDRSSLDGAGNLSINCDKDIAYTISLNGGQGRLNERRMTAGAYSLEYNLYTDASRTLVWGDGTGTSSTVSGSGTVSSLPIYGRIPAGQNGHVGSYSDTVVLSIDF